jgi:hypothetical protein
VARRADTLRISLAAAVCCALGLALVPSAQATITGSHVAKPKDPHYLVYDRDNPNTFAVKGTTSGGNPAVDKVDLLCFHGSTYESVDSVVPLANDGSFSVPNADLSALEFTLCRLRAVPAASVPSNLTPFKGPLLGGDSQSTYDISSGPNAGALYDFYFWAQQRQAAFDYDSLTSCGIDDGYLMGSDLDIATTTFYCNAWLWKNEDFTNEAASTRSELQVDGKNAYGPESAQSVNDQASPGFQPLHFSIDVDPLTGETTIRETDKIVRCPNETFPPTPVSCPRFVSTHVVDKRTIVQDHKGHLSVITDRFKATDNHAHQLDLLWQNDQSFHDSSSPFDATTIAYRFPGQSSFSTHAVGDVVNLPKKHPASILIKQEGAPDGNKQTGRGAIVYDRRAKSATFNRSSTSQNDFYLHQHAEIPNDGAAKFHFAYAQAFKQKAVNELAHKAENAFG